MIVQANNFWEISKKKKTEKPWSYIFIITLDW